MYQIFFQAYLQYYLFTLNIHHKAIGIRVDSFALYLYFGLIQS